LFYGYRDLYYRGPSPITKKETKMTDFIERLENVKRVLEAMDPHEREKHFNMEMWGRRTDCGTVGCAAGHASLDPWFQENGFKGRINPAGNIELWDDEFGWTVFSRRKVTNFFGKAGVDIFLDDTLRSVETVIAELDRAILTLRETEKAVP
jgi:hypothetical protein